MLRVNSNKVLRGDAFEIFPEDDEFPNALKLLPDAPKKLYLIGNPNALREGIGIVGARRATPYGISCTTHFARIAARQGIVVISGGAYGCDSASHKAALKEKKATVVFLGGGCNEIYPVGNTRMYQAIIDNQGAVVSEQPWDYPPLRHNFLQRNRLIAGLSKALLIVEAGLPSGTFSTADFAIKSSKEVLAVPGPITNENSSGCNKLIYEGAKPIINDEVFYNALFEIFGFDAPKEYSQVIEDYESKPHKVLNSDNPILNALCSQAMSMDDLYKIAKNYSKSKNPSVWLSEKLVEAESTGRVGKYPNGMYGPVLKS